MSFAPLRYAVGGLGAGEPVSLSIAGVFNSDGTGSGTSGNYNWTSEAPSPGIGARYWVKFTLTSSTGGATLGNNNVVQSMEATGVSGGVNYVGPGSVNFTYTIYSNAAGTQVITSGTGVYSNEL